MRIEITATVDIDPELWQSEYGATADEVESDVQAYYAQILYQCAEKFNQTGAHPI